MGYDLNRFEGDVDQELICPICSDVLQDPVQAPVCEHAFCRECIMDWLNIQSTCPVDRQPITAGQLRIVPRILKNLLSRLKINCDYENYGCRFSITFDSLKSHVEDCDYNPKKPVSCEDGCGLIIPKDEMNTHNCIVELRKMIDSQHNKLQEFEQIIADLKHTVNEQSQELILMKDFMRRMKTTNPAMRGIADQMEKDIVVRWSNSLARARVTRWGGMISTPDESLQNLIKRSLLESLCPGYLNLNLNIIDELMKNCHERRWPPGLSSLETRQNNRRLYEEYVCKRVPGRQAVLVLKCDNSHVGEDMMVEPGLVMIFAHGIE